MRTMAGFLLILLAGTCVAQERIRVDVSLVSVAFSVRDARGALVDNLTKDDVDVLEDGARDLATHSFQKRSLK